MTCPSMRARQLHNFSSGELAFAPIPFYITTNKLEKFSTVSLQTRRCCIPSQLKVTQQILFHWQPFRDLELKFVGSRRQEQLSSRCQQRVVATVEESVLRTEMAGLESQEEDAPKRVLFYKPMSWLGQIRSHRRDSVSPGLLVSGRRFSPPPWALRSL